MPFVIQKKEGKRNGKDSKNREPESSAESQRHAAPVISGVLWRRNFQGADEYFRIGQRKNGNQPGSGNRYRRDYENGLVYGQGGQSAGKALPGMGGGNRRVSSGGYHQGVYGAAHGQHDLADKNKKRRRGGELTTQNYIAAVISSGFSVADLEHMSVGMVMDVLSEFIPEEDRIRIATQADIDKYL